MLYARYTISQTTYLISHVTLATTSDRRWLGWYVIRLFHHLLTAEPISRRNRPHIHSFARSRKVQEKSRNHEWSLHACCVWWVPTALRKSEFSTLFFTGDKKPKEFPNPFSCFKEEEMKEKIVSSSKPLRSWKIPIDMVTRQS